MANIATAEVFLGSNYLLNAAPTSSDIDNSTIQSRSSSYTYNPYSSEANNTIYYGSIDGNKTYSFNANNY